MVGRKSNSGMSPYGLGITPQSSIYGSTIPVIYGCYKTALSLIWASQLRKVYASKKSKKKNMPSFVENVDFLLGCNPISGVLQAWSNNNQKFPLTFVKHVYTGSMAIGNITIGDPDFYWVVGVTATLAYSASFDDYGGYGPSTPSGTFELPIWNANYAGPDPVNESGFRNAPWVYRWIPGSGDTISFDYSPFLLWPVTPSAINIYYAKLNTASGIGKKSHGSTLVTKKFSVGTPIGQLRLTFEPQLGDGPEYSTPTDKSAEQIIYPFFAGLGSPDLDLGEATMLPNIRPEVLGSFPVNPRGDADFMDMVEDIFKSGPVQNGVGAPGALGEIQHGLACNDYPGVVQKKFFSAPTGGIGNLAYDLPNTEGGKLIVTISNSAGFDFTIADDAGNSWTKITPATGVVNFRAWKATAVAWPAGNKVTFPGFSGFSYNNVDCQIFELGGLDTVDQVVVDTGSSAAAAGSITPTNLPRNPGYIMAIAFTPPAGGGAFPANTVIRKWNPLIQANQPVPGSYLNTYYQSSYYRSIRFPGTFPISIPLDGSVDWILLLVSFKNSQAPPWPYMLGNILDDGPGGTMQNTRDQCRAYGLIGSLYMSSQQKASGYLQDIFKAANAAPVWSGFKLKIIPYAEASTVGNGAIYTSPTASGPIANLTERDMIAEGTDPPVKVERTAQVDSPPIQSIQHANRDSDYEDVMTTQPEQANTAIYGVRKDAPVRLNSIVDSAVARKILTVLVRRMSYVRNLYKFKLTASRGLLEPMDLVTIPLSSTMALPDPNQANLPLIPLRLTKVTEDEKFNLDCEAEPFIYGLNSPTLNLGVTAPAPYQPTVGDVPDLINDPIIFEPVPRLAGIQNANPLMMVVSDADPIYGGCVVYVSTDGGSSYNPVNNGIIQGNAITGYTVGDWPAHADPDTTNDLAVDLTESLGNLSSFLAADRDNFVFPFWVKLGTTAIPYELGAYNDAVQTAAYKYTLKATGTGNKLRRGVFGAPTPAAGVDHPDNTRFAFLGSPQSGAQIPGVIVIPMDPNWIGKTLHFKFVAFNQTGAGFQQLADVADYTYTPLGSGLVSNPNANNYTLNPASPLSQTDATHVAFAATTATFPSNQTKYNARSLSVSDPGSGNTQIYYVTIYDPGYVGDNGSGTNLTATISTTKTGAHVGEPGYIYMGSIVVQHVAGGNSVAPGGAPIASPITEVDITATDTANPGNFTKAHGLGRVPVGVSILMTSAGALWTQVPAYDDTNLYLVASDSSLTAKIFLW